MFLPHQSTCCLTRLCPETTVGVEGWPEAPPRVPSRCWTCSLQRSERSVWPGRQGKQGAHGPWGVTGACWTWSSVQLSRETVLLSFIRLTLPRPQRQQPGRLCRKGRGLRGARALPLLTLSLSAVPLCPLCVVCGPPVPWGPVRPPQLLLGTLSPGGSHGLLK